MRSGEPPGVVASDLTIRIRPRAAIASRFLTGYLSFLYLTGYWKARAGGASGTMKKITRTQILSEQLPVPPPPEQLRLVAQLQSQLSEVARARQSLTAQLQAIERLPAALLRRAFNGEL